MGRWRKNTETLKGGWKIQLERRKKKAGKMLFFHPYIYIYILMNWNIPNSISSQGFFSQEQPHKVNFSWMFIMNKHYTAAIPTPQDIPGARELPWPWNLQGKGENLPKIQDFLIKKWKVLKCGKTPNHQIIPILQKSMELQHGSQGFSPRLYPEREIWI